MSEFVIHGRKKDALDQVSNHAVKALTYVGLVALGETTEPSLGDHISERTGLDLPRPGSYAYTYAKFGFAVVHMGTSAYSNRSVRHFSPHDAEHALPVIGEVLDWALRYGLAPRLFLSESHSKSTRSPANSIEIFDRIRAGKAVCEFEHPGYVPGGAHNSRLGQMIKAGLIEEVEENIFTIDNPVYNGKKSFDKLPPARQHVYKSLKAGKLASPDKEWTIDEFTEFSEIMYPGELDDATMRKLRRIIVSAVSKSAPRDLPGAVHKIDITHSKFRVVEAYQEAVDDIVERMKILGSGDGATIKRATDRAHEIYDDEDSAFVLATIGLAASPF